MENSNWFKLYRIIHKRYNTYYKTSIIIIIMNSDLSCFITQALGIPVVPDV